MSSEGRGVKKSHDADTKEQGEVNKLVWDTRMQPLRWLCCQTVNKCDLHICYVSYTAAAPLLTCWTRSGVLRSMW